MSYSYTKFDIFLKQGVCKENDHGILGLINYSKIYLPLILYLLELCLTSLLAVFHLYHYSVKP